MKLKALRKGMGWSQQELARRANIPQSTIHYIEKGRDARQSTIRKLASALGVTVAELLEDGIKEKDDTLNKKSCAAL